MISHVKNIAFLMNRRGEWRLSPAFNVSYAWNPDGPWTSRHHMSINDKREGFSRDDLLPLARMTGIKKVRANQLLDHVVEAARRWPEFAAEAGVDEARTQAIKRSHRGVL